MIFRIISTATSVDGIDLVPFIGEEGLDWQANGIDSPDAGRALDMTMYRGLLGYKAKCQVACLWMGKEDAERVMQAIMPEFVTVVTDTIPWETGTKTLTMYSNNIKAKCLTEYTDGTKLYGDVEFPLVER